MNAPYATFCAAFRAPDFSGSRTVRCDDGPEGRVERGESQRREERGEWREEKEREYIYVYVYIERQRERERERETERSLRLHRCFS